MKFIMDDGHGWLEVSLVEHPKAWNYGTGYGYIDDDTSTIYLEEDCEALGFIKWLYDGDVSKARELPHEIVSGESAIRRLPHNEAVFDTSKLYA
jgi:hypothetical protein